MSVKKLCLASDNWAPAHPAVMQAVVEANRNSIPAYGADQYTQEAQRLIQEAFGREGLVMMIPSGTGSNVLALKIACLRHESVICTDIAHIQYQESGAAEAIVGCKLLTVPHQDGKITPEAVVAKIRSERAFGRHSTSPRVLSVTQPTEMGTVYQMEELRALSQLCQAENLLLHVDGSRIYQAAVSLNVSLSEMMAAMQADILSLGGTKNGLLGAEALFVVNPSLHRGCDHLQKQTLQLLSKMRFISAQFIPFFKTGLWRTLAEQANQKAREIAQIIQEIPEFSLSYPVETNQIFFTAPSEWISPIQESIYCYLWNQDKNEIRLIASWNTSDEEVRSLRSFFLNLKF